MKISGKDPNNVILGKLPSIETFIEMNKQRNRLASKIMAQQHISRGDALGGFDKQVNGDAIRNKINNELNPKPTEKEIKFMADKYNTTTDDIKNRLRAKGIL